jgi:hypothetical protein
MPQHLIPTRRAFFCRILLTMMLAFAWLDGYAQSDAQAVENQVKAAFLYKFASYVEWPPQSFEKPDSTFVIGVLEGDGFAQVLEQTIAGRSMNGRPVVVQRLRRGDVPKGVHMLYIARTDASAMNEALAAAKGLAVLTVTDSERGLSAGCMISFVIENNKVRFDIAPEPAESNRLKISARLLSVARKVAGRTSG